ncbi:MAG: NFACT RNA binding domain-containing protein [Acholeplasmatales bacterium]|jgi:predicted ribosome quality control (RQC) complex YloA/Tae2 family protein|nr:NFACT RNA binding domain-containing protein [Acholeplasmatales bacterium]
MALDGFFIYNLINELKPILLGSRLEKIKSIDKDSYVFTFFHFHQKHYLYLSIASSRNLLFLGQAARDELETGITPLLRQKIESGILTDIYQYKTDRVITFTFTINDYFLGKIKRELVFEVMGKYANLILVQDDIILDAAKKNKISKKRNTFPGEKFYYLESDKEPFNNISYENILRPKDLVDKYLGISPFLANYLFVQKKQVDEIVINPCVNLSNKDFYAFNLFLTENNIKYLESLSSVQNYNLNYQSKNKILYEKFISNNLKKLSEKLILFENEISTHQENIDKIYIANYIYDNLDPNLRVSELVINDEKILLNPLKNLNENAQMIYKLYHKGKSGLKILENLIEETKTLINYFKSLEFDLSYEDSILSEIEESLIELGFKRKEKLKSKKKKAPKIITIKSNDYTILVGKNSLQNEYITRTLGNKNDLFFHVSNAHGSHVLLQGEKNDTSIHNALLLAGYFSELRSSNKVSINYTLLKNVKRVPKIKYFLVTLENYITKVVNLDLSLINELLSNQNN